MDAWRLPPLKALRSFEAAARHLSFSRAADELCVTPGAVSRQVMLLEQYLGTHLFHRLHRQICLSAAGKTLLSTVHGTFGAIEATAESIRMTTRARALHIVCPMLFGTNWLVPRIQKFYAKAPDVKLRLSSDMLLDPSGAAAPDADMFVLGKPNPVWLNSPLFPAKVSPICSPSLLEKQDSILTPHELRQFRLLYSAQTPRAWAQWFEGTGCSVPPQDSSVTFPNSLMAFQAAIAGMGCAIANVFLTQDVVSAGQLTFPTRRVVDLGWSYYLVYRPELAGHRPAMAFKEWLLEESAGSLAAFDANETLIELR